MYPVIGGFLDLIGGLALARWFSLACMLGVTSILYSVTTRLFTSPAGVSAAALYASTGVVLFLGRLATFDALCLLLVALAVSLAVGAVSATRPLSALLVGPVLALAVMTKYAALLFVVPVFCLLACQGVSVAGAHRTRSRLITAMISFGLSLASAYSVLDRHALKAVTSTTTDRVVAVRASRDALGRHALEMGGIVYGLSLIGLLLLVRRRHRAHAPATLLLLSSLLVPAYHLYKREPISFDKHLAYALFFAAPLAGYAVARTIARLGRPAAGEQRTRWLAALALGAGLVAFGAGQAQTLYSDWPNTSSLAAVLDRNIRDGVSRIFAEDIEVSRYDARQVSQEWQWSSFYYSDYVDPAGRRLSGTAALAAAVQHRYYDLIELSFTTFAAPAYTVARDLALTRNYDLIAVLPLVDSHQRGRFFVWRRATLGGHGSFTSVSELTTTRYEMRG